MACDESRCPVLPDFSFAHADVLVEALELRQERVPSPPVGDVARDGCDKVVEVRVQDPPRCGRSTMRLEYLREREPTMVRRYRERPVKS